MRTTTSSNDSSSSSSSPATSGGVCGGCRVHWRRCGENCPYAPYCADPMVTQLEALHDQVQELELETKAQHTQIQDLKFRELQLRCQIREIELQSKFADQDESERQAQMQELEHRAKEAQIREFELWTELVNQKKSLHARIRELELQTQLADQNKAQKLCLRIVNKDVFFKIMCLVVVIFAYVTVVFKSLTSLWV